MMNRDQLDQLIIQAKAELKARNFPAAIQIFQSVIAEDDVILVAHEGLASAFYQLQDFPNAITHYKRVTQLNPRNADAYISLGAIYNHMQSFRDAIDILRKALTKDTSSSTVYYNLGIAYRGTKQFPLAVSAYREAIRIDPQMTIAHQNMGNTYLELGNRTLASESYQKALKIDPHFEPAKLALEQINAANAASESKENPFGRLVDEDKLRSQSRKRIIVRAMSVEDRVDDRETLHRLSQKAEQQARKLKAFLTESLSPTLASINRVVIENKEGAGEWATVYTELITNNEAFKRLYRVYKKTILELRGHEEIMNTPDLEGIQTH